MSRPDLPDPSRLWRHMQDTHGISLLVSEEADIVNAVNEDHHHALEAALAERDEARAALAEVEQENDQLLASNKNYERDWPILVHERDEAREALAEETQFHNRTHGELVKTQCVLMDARAALQRITECDMRWSKKIARDALEAAK